MVVTTSLSQACWRNWTPIKYPEPAAKPASVVVSDFYQLDRRGSFTDEMPFAILRGQAYAANISYDVATYLQEKGVQARAFEGAEPTAMTEGQLLVRGVVIGGVDIYAETIWPVLIAGLPTLFILGAILPLPYPLADACDFSYRVEILDSNGGVVRQFSQTMSYVMKTLYLYGLSSSCGDSAEEAQRIALEAVAVSLGLAPAPASR